MNKVQISILRTANRPCGVSYRSACKRGIDLFKDLEKQGYLYIHDNVNKLSRYSFNTTDKAKDILKIEDKP